MNFCISGLTSAVGTCSVFAGTLRGVFAVPSASAGTEVASIAAASIIGAAIRLCMRFMEFIPCFLGPCGR